MDVNRYLYDSSALSSGKDPAVPIVYGAEWVPRTDLEKVAEKNISATSIAVLNERKIQ
jgi:hypothetical protein